MPACKCLWRYSYLITAKYCAFRTLTPGKHFTQNIVKYILFKRTFYILIEISLFLLWAPLAISHDWFKLRPGAEQTPSHYLSQWPSILRVLMSWGASIYAMLTLIGGLSGISCKVIPRDNSYFLWNTCQWLLNEIHIFSLTNAVAGIVCYERLSFVVDILWVKPIYNANLSKLSFVLTVWLKITTSIIATWQNCKWKYYLRCSYDAEDQYWCEYTGKYFRKTILNSFSNV